MARDVTTSVAHLRICASAPSLFASVSLSEVLGCGESPCRSQWDFDGHVVFLPTTVLNASHSCSQPCHAHLITFPTHSRWLKISSWRKNALHGSGARFLSAVHADLLIMEAQVGQLQAQLAQTQTELQYAIEQIRILTLQVNSNASVATAAATTTAPTATTAGSHSQMPKVNHQ